MPRRNQTYAELARFHSAMDACGDAIYLVDRATMRFVDVNQTACARMGYSRDELLQMGPQDLLTVSRGEIERLYDEAIAAGASGTTTESTARTKDGQATVTELHRRALRTEDGWIIVSVARDITDRSSAQAAVRESAAKLRLFADNIPALTAAWDENLHCSFVNRRYAEFFGSTAEQILGKHLREILGDAVFREIEGHFARALQGHPVTYQRVHRSADGTRRHIENKLLPNIAIDGRVMGCFSVTTDITERKLLEERVQHVAHHDILTGLPNRLLFNDRLFQSISLAKRDSRQFALLYLDLDKFKPVNDALGHGAGDELLQAVAARIRLQVRESDTVARVGGDEFIVILPAISGREQATAVARKIVAALAKPFELGDSKQAVHIGVSIGIAVYPADAMDADTLVNAADADMYRDKQGKRDHPHMSVVQHARQ